MKKLEKLKNVQPSYSKKSKIKVLDGPVDHIYGTRPYGCTYTVETGNWLFSDIEYHPKVDWGDHFNTETLLS